jgi:hypothetical protein
LHGVRAHEFIREVAKYIQPFDAVTLGELILMSFFVGMVRV